MKKSLLLAVLGLSVLSAGAQVTLPGTSPYTQTFEGLPTYPTGWSTYTNATSTTVGSLQSIQYFGQSFPSVLRPDTACIGNVNVGGFKNFPSATVSQPGDNYCATTPPSYTNRALGIRQVGNTNSTFPNSDPGVAFVLKLANTTGHSAFNLSFKLQSLDTSSARITTWTVDYGVAATTTTAPTAFTPATAVGTMTTGGNTFSNNTITVNFGGALDNKSTPVYIRIAALSPSTLPAGATSGTRPSSAIDDFTLTYAGTTNAVEDIATQSQLGLTVLGQVTSTEATFAYTANEAGDYSFVIYDVTGRKVHAEMVHATSGTQQLKVSGLNLTTGMYIAKMSNETSSSVAKMILQ